MLYLNAPMVGLLVCLPPRPAGNAGLRCEELRGFTNRLTNISGPLFLGGIAILTCWLLLTSSELLLVFCKDGVSDGQIDPLAAVQWPLCTNGSVCMGFRPHGLGPGFLTMYLLRSIFKECRLRMLSMLLAKGGVGTFGKNSRIVVAMSATKCARFLFSSLLILALRK